MTLELIGCLTKLKILDLSRNDLRGGKSNHFACFDALLPKLSSSLIELNLCGTHLLESPDEKIELENLMKLLSFPRAVLLDELTQQHPGTILTWRKH